MEDLRVALIGYGLAGRVFHAPLITATSGLCLATVVTASSERQAQLRSDHPGAQILERADDLWSRPGDHQLVVIAAPTAAHSELAGAAVDHGIPVVVDKPLAADSGEAQALVRRARNAGVLLSVFHNRRWDSDQLTLKRLLEEGRLGNVLRYESRFERWRPALRPGAWRETAAPAQGGGQLLDLGSHLVDQALVLFGDPTHVYAELDSHRGAPADDDAFLALGHAGGVISHLHASAMSAAPGPRLRVLGDRAAYLISELDGQEQALRAGARPDTVADWGAEPESAWGELSAGDGRSTVRSERGDWPRYYRLLVEALRAGGPPPVDARDAVLGLRVLGAARRSAARREVVKLADDSWPG